MNTLLIPKKRRNQKMINDNFSISLVSNTLNDDVSKNLLCKEFRINSTNEIEKLSHATLVKGVCETKQLQDLIQLQLLFDDLQHNQAIILGTHEAKGQYNIASKKYKESNPYQQLVTRDKNNFSFNAGKSLMMLDFDGHPLLDEYTVKTFRKMIIQLFPFLKNIEMLIVPSSSANIYRSDTNGPANKFSGMHIYILIDNGLNIESVGERLKYHQWIENIGYHKISKDGKLLERHLFDDMVYSAERLIFEAPPKVHEGIKFKKRDYASYDYFPGEVLKTSGLELSDDERQEMNSLIAADKLNKSPKSQAARKEYKEQLINDFVSKNVPKPKAIDYATQLLDSEIQVLPHVLELKSNKNGYISVGDVVSDVDKYTNDTFVDPLQTRDSNEFRAKVFKNPDGSVIIYSMRHGGTNYILKNKDIDTILETINECNDINNLLILNKKIKEYNNISNNDYSLIINEYNKKNKELTNINLTSKELNRLFAKNSFEPRADGVYYHTQKNDEHVSIRISGYIEVIGITRDKNDENYGITIKFKTITGQPKICNMPRTHIFERNGIMLRFLVNQGLHIETDYTKDFERYMNMQTNSEKLYYVTDQTGWYDDNTYIMPHKTIGSNHCLYLSNSISGNPYSENGSLHDWKTNIARYCVDNKLLMLSVCAAFAGPLLDKVNMDGGGFHIYGTSSTGKSTTSRVSASVFGEYNDFMKNWRCTNNGLEAMAAIYNDSILILDEISQNKSGIENNVYMLANGTGKVRANRFGGACKSKKWKVFVLSNGERTADSHSQESSNKTVNAGAQLRMLNIPVSGKYGIYDNLHGFESGKELSEHLSSYCKINYGIAGVAFIESLIKDNENIVDKFNYYQAYFNELHLYKYKQKLSSQEQRALKYFSLVATAAYFIVKHKIADWNEVDCSCLIFQCFLDWKDSQMGITGEDIESNQVLEAFTDFIDKHRSGRFQNLYCDDKNRHIINQAGFIKSSEDGNHYLFNKSAFKEVLAGIDMKYAIRVLKQKKWLIHNKGRNDAAHTIHGHWGRYFEICIRNFDDEDVKEISDEFSNMNPLKKLLMEEEFC
jgi:putative DNA primase/helicase